MKVELMLDGDVQIRLSMDEATTLHLDLETTQIRGDTQASTERLMDELEEALGLSEVEEFDDEDEDDDDFEDEPDDEPIDFDEDVGDAVTE